MGKVTLVQTEAFLSLCLENRGRFDTWLLRGPYPSYRSPYLSRRLGLVITSCGGSHGCGVAVRQGPSTALYMRSKVVSGHSHGRGSAMCRRSSAREQTEPRVRRRVAVSPIGQ